MSSAAQLRSVDSWRGWTTQVYTATPAIVFPQQVNLALLLQLSGRKQFYAQQIVMCLLLSRVAPGCRTCLVTLL
jgi:hypothetical protein